MPSRSRTQKPWCWRAEALPYLTMEGLERPLVDDGHVGQVQAEADLRSARPARHLHLLFGREFLKGPGGFRPSPFPSPLVPQFQGRIHGHQDETLPPPEKGDLAAVPDAVDHGPAPGLPLPPPRPDLGA